MLNQGSFWVWVQPMGDDATFWRCFQLAEPILHFVPHRAPSPTSRGSDRVMCNFGRNGVAVGKVGWGWGLCVGVGGISFVCHHCFRADRFGLGSALLLLSDVVTVLTNKGSAALKRKSAALPLVNRFARASDRSSVTSPFCLDTGIHYQFPSAGYISGLI